MKNCYICGLLEKHKTNYMDKKLYLIPALRFIAYNFDENFLVSTTANGSTIEDATEEEWTL